VEAVFRAETGFDLKDYLACGAGVRNFPMIDALRALLQDQRQRTDACEKVLGRRIPWIFQTRKPKFLSCW
jgi:hypothetical protein